jgi:GT2 family glycosyltransferase
MASPSVSVVMPAYNSERFLGEAIESILDQTFSDFELVIVDDGSTDSTPRILAEYAADDSRVVVHRQANGGSAAALNAGVDRARAPFIARLDSDDIAMPDRLGRQHRFLSTNESVGVVGGEVTVIDEDGRAVAEVRYPLSDAEIRKALAKTTPFVHSAVMMRRTAFERAGGYRPNFDMAEDIDLWLRIAEQSELANLEAMVAMYRVHASQASAQKLEQQAICALAARTSARLRAAGRPDPFDGSEPIDEHLLLSQGASVEEIDAFVVHSAIWLAKTLDRAGYRRAAGQLFSEAYDRARPDSSSGELVAAIQRAVAVRHAEQGHRVRAKLKFLQARLSERRRPSVPA